MFSYYGGKGYIKHLYPEPRYRMVIEPFCGAAWYSVTHSDRNVLINDVDARIVGIWEWLVKDATYEAMMPHRKFVVGDRVADLDIDQRHRDFLGFCLGEGVSSPSQIATPRGCRWVKYPKFKSNAYKRINDAIQMLESIRHWQVTNLSYLDLPDIVATWFIDPPYQQGGHGYRHNKVDYRELAEWCMSRRGEVIVCENNKADWLPFEPLVKVRNSQRANTEMVYYRLNR